MHRRILVGAMREWYISSTLPAWAVMIAAVLAAHLLVPADLPRTIQFGLVVGMLMLVFCGLIAVLPYPRALFAWLYRNRRKIWSQRSMRGLRLLDAWEAEAMNGRGVSV
jgi:hypothetical protein